MIINRYVLPAVVAAAAAILAVGLDRWDTTSEAQVTAAPTATPGVPGRPGAIAPMPRMLAIDRGMLLRMSAAGKSIVLQAQQLQKSAEAEFKAAAERLQADGRAFQQQSAILAAGVRAQKQRELEGRRTALQQRMQARGGQIQAGINNAVQQVETALGPILQQIMKERQADIILDRGAIVMSRLDMDITPAAIQRLDRLMPRVPVQLANPPTAQTARGPAPRPTAPRPPGQ